MMISKCSCGEELKFEEAESPLGNDTDIRFLAYCQCKRRWELVDTTDSYEEMVMNEIIEPQHGEYKDGDVWFYEDGSCMESGR